MKIIKTQSGITLIALIITIAVLLILVGVTIGTLDKTNIIGRAKDTVKEYEKEKENENKAITNTEEILEKYIEDLNKEKKEEELPVWGVWEFEDDGIALCYLGEEKNLKVTSNKIKVQDVVANLETYKLERIEGTIRETTFEEFDQIVFYYGAPQIETVDFGNVLFSNNDVRLIGCTNIREVKGIGGISRLNNDSYGYCSIMKIEIPESVTFIDNIAFNQSNNITAITIKRNKSDAEEVLGTEWIPESVTTIIYNDTTITR